jgi:hypothetical protein
MEYFPFLQTLHFLALYTFEYLPGGQSGQGFLKKLSIAFSDRSLKVPGIHAGVGEGVGFGVGDGVGFGVGLAVCCGVGITVLGNLEQKHLQSLSRYALPQ